MKRKTLLLVCGMALFAAGFYSAKVSRLMNPNYRVVGIANATDCKINQASIVLPSRTIVLDGPQVDKRWYVNEEQQDRNGFYIPVPELKRVEYQVKVSLDGCPQQFAKTEMVSSGKYIDLWLVSGTSGGGAL